MKTFLGEQSTVCVCVAESETSFINRLNVFALICHGSHWNKTTVTEWKTKSQLELAAKKAQWN